MGRSKVKILMKNISARASVFLFCLALLSLFMRFTSFESNFYYEYKLRKGKVDPPFTSLQDKWIDSVFNSLTPSERIAQLIMVPAYMNDNGYHEKEVIRLIEKYNIGGLIFFEGNPSKLASLTNKFQALAKTPLIISIDAECGLAMRLDSTIKYPDQMTLGAINNEKLIYDMGAHIATQLKYIGVHINLAPVIDVNNNPENPIINYRSFGEDRINVARKGILYMKGMQDNNIIAVAKHFPGHGDTDDDSHYTLPLIPHSRQRLDSIELFPFKELINSGIGGVMTAHLSIPALDDSPKLASSLSKIIVTDLLKDEMGFKGLVITDAMNMGGVSKHFKPGEANVKAIIAGNDILLMPYNVPKAISLIQREIRKGNISQEEIYERCRKILAAKYWTGLNNYEPVNLKDLNTKLNTPEFKLLHRKLIEASLTLVKNRKNIIPLKRLDTLSVASIALGCELPNAFQNTIELYTKVDKICMGKDAGLSKVNDKLKNHNLIIVSIHNTSTRISDNYGITDKTIEFVDSISEQYNVILNIAANPYSLAGFKNLDKLQGLLVSYEDTETTQSLSAQLLFGAVPSDGSLPVSVNKIFTAGTGIKTKGIMRLKYTVPEEADLNENKLSEIDSVAHVAIQNKATPGCQILVARKGMVAYNKSFGYHTYSRKRKVENSDLYDLASITKIASTMPLIMQLYEEGKIDINEKISVYLPFLDTTDKKDIVIKDILLHQSLLKAWIPFYKSTLEPAYPDQKFSSNRFSQNYPIKIGPGYYANKHLKYRDGYYNKKYGGDYTVKVAENLYINKFFVDSIYHKIANSELNGQEGYKYSDLGFYLLYRIIEDKISGSFKDYVESEIYDNLGAFTMCFLPLEKYSKEQIVPTEDDIIFRKQILHGYVHDPGAAMLGGVCGHAGLFSNANDLAKLMQMYLNGGTYGGKRYIKEKTVSYFTSCPECGNGNRRGLGFDKPEPDTTKNGPAYEGVSPGSYGHTGFTGTMVWIDPEYEIIYIFLSNRVYPDAVNNKLIEMDLRTNIQNIIYDAIKK